ncbi:unnamed protein product [Rhodiola kirilowii]
MNRSRSLISFFRRTKSTLSAVHSQSRSMFNQGHYIVGLALLEKEKYDEGVTELEKAGHPQKMANVWEMLAEKIIFLIIGNASLLGCCLLYHDKKSWLQLFH